MPVTIVDVNQLVRNWWAFLIRGMAAVIFGALTFVSPRISLVALVLIFGAYAFADGVFAIVMAIRQRGTRSRWWILILEGLAGLGAGAVTLFYPRLTALALLYLIAAWAVITGVLEVVLAVRIRKAVTGEWLLALSGVLSVALGVMLMLFPAAGALALVLWIGAYAIVFGVLLVALSFRLRSWAKRHDRPDVLPPPHSAPGAASA
jgi:uncharacterized membrane protein HdeD (DUF308 family)